MSVICDTCGARLPEGAGMCELCGTSVDGVEHEASIVEDEIVDVLESASVFCTSCGRKNPAGANYCKTSRARRVNHVNSKPLSRLFPVIMGVRFSTLPNEPSVIYLIESAP